jgi:hypothetical protein
MMNKKKIAFIVVTLIAVAAALAMIVPNGNSSSDNWPFSVPSATLTQAGITLSDPTSADPGNGKSAQAAAAHLFAIPTSAASYMHCVDTFINPKIDQDCYVVQFDASKFQVPNNQSSGAGPERLSWFIGLVDPTTGEVLETRGAG